MKTHTELLTELLDAVYAVPCMANTAEIRKVQMRAAEIRGQMLATCATTTEPQPDADGWVENTGVVPKCEIKAIRFHNGDIENTADKVWAWDFLDTNTACHITHYKPA